MNIIILNSSKQWGGNERWLISLANGLIKKKHSVFLCIRKGSEHWKNLDEKIKILEAPFTNELSIKTKMILCKCIKKNKIDLILSTKRKDYFIGGRVKKEMNIPHVIRLGISRKILKRDLLQRRLFKKRVDGIVVNAKALKNELLEYSFVSENIKKDNILAVYNGYQFPRVKTRRKLKSKKIIFRSAGRLTFQKGYDFLISAARALQAQKIDFVIEIAGDGPEKKSLKKMIKTNSLEDRIILFGEVENVIEFFSQSDIVIIPSRSEGIPNTLFEAWHAKKPVVLTKVGGVGEVVKHNFNGLICEPEQQDINEKIVQASALDSNIKKLGIEGYKTLNKSFTIDTMIEKLEEFFLKF